jgi:hypothetical protein
MTGMLPNEESGAYLVEESDSVRIGVPVGRDGRPEIVYRARADASIATGR